MSEISIGTSGWHYPHWVGPFYPEGTRPAAFRRLDAECFSTVEINNTFHQLPTAARCAAGPGAAPAGATPASASSAASTMTRPAVQPKTPCGPSACSRRESGRAAGDAAGDRWSWPPCHGGMIMPLSRSQGSMTSKTKPGRPSMTPQP